MQVITATDFTKLAAIRSKPAVSIYLPTHRAGVEVNELQDAQLFKSQLQEARQRLEAHGMGPGEVTALIQEGTKLLDTPDFWRDQQDGLAVFMADGFFFTQKTPRRLAQELFIGPHFYVVPLIPFLKPKPFFLLALNKGNARFFKGNRYGLEEVTVKGLPNGMEDVVRFEEKGGQEMFRRAGNKGKGTFHGHGPGLADEEEYVGMYLKEVDRTLMSEVLGNEKSPLLLAGAERMTHHYREISRYPHLSDTQITGNYEYEHTHWFHDKAREALQLYFHEDTERALENYFNQSATALTSTDPFKVLAACYHGKVADLFIRDGLHLFGEFNEETGQVRFQDAPSLETECLLNQAAVQAYLANGDVYVLDEEKMPEKSKVAALMRYV